MVIDVHAHAIIPAAMALVGPEPGFQADRAREAELLGEESAAEQGKMAQRVGPLLFDLDARLGAMDAAGIDLQLVSPSPAHYCDWADATLAATIATTVNTGIAELVQQRPSRLQGLGFAPLHAAEDALVQAMGELGLHGVEISSFGPGVELGDAELEPFWAKAEELGALIFVHPWGCTLDERLDRHFLRNIVGQPVEHAVALSHVILSGLLDRHPGLKLLWAHGGGYLPFHPGRMDHGWSVRPELRTPAQKPSSYFSRMWFDSLVYEPELLEQLVARVGADRVLLGSDYPFDMGHPDPVGHVHAAPGLDADAKRCICGANAQALLGLGQGART
jgi:aminocarboxymuconate-semialdehyde decarboxylase